MYWETRIPNSYTIAWFSLSELKLLTRWEMYSSWKCNLKFKPYWGNSHMNCGERIAFIFCCFSKRTDTCWAEEIRPRTRVFHEDCVCCPATELKASAIPWCTEVIWKTGQRSQGCHSSICFNHWQAIFIPTLEILRWGRHPRGCRGNIHAHMGITLCLLTRPNHIISVSNVHNFPPSW